MADADRGCNVQTVCLTPHCHGTTHTEGYGHIHPAATPIQDLVNSEPGPALLISLTPRPALSAGDTYSCALPEDYPMIGRALLRRALDEELLSNLVFGQLNQAAA